VIVEDRMVPSITEEVAEIGWKIDEISSAELRRHSCGNPKSVWLLPPDIIRMYSGAGRRGAAAAATPSKFPGEPWRSRAERGGLNIILSSHRNHQSSPI
jgi:hypothetical protein